MTLSEAEFAERIRKLEEAQAFAEHSAEQLSAEVLELSRRLQAALARVERLEQRVGQVAAQVEPGEPVDGEE